MDHSREEQLRLAKHFERAQGWLLLDKFEEAASALQEIPPVFHRSPEVMFFRGQLHLAAKQWALAEPVLRQVLRDYPDEPQHWVSLAYVVRRAISIAEAEPILREARQRFPAVALIWFNLACYAAQQDRLSEVRDLLAEALRLEPQLLEQA